VTVEPGARPKRQTPMKLQRVLALFVLLTAGGLIAACGSDISDAGLPDGSDISDAGVGDASTRTGSSPAAPEITISEPPVAVLVAQRGQRRGTTSLAGASVTDFGLDLFAELRSQNAQANITISPLSIAIALAMLEPGTVDAARDQIRALLRIDDAAEFHASMNALEQSLEARTPVLLVGDGDPGEVVIRVANAAYLQEGYPFRPDYLEAVGSSYGPVLWEVDFAPDPDAVAREINEFVADATDDRIVDLIGDGVIRDDTVLALVNALYFKASWLGTFDEDATSVEPFTLLDGDDVEVPMMIGRGTSSARGERWVGATKSYVGGLTVQFILPASGSFEAVVADLPSVLAEYEQNRTSGASLGVPRFATRSNTDLDVALMGLGLTAPYMPHGLTGIADDPKLVVYKVMHEAFVAMDEDGTEAAAATVVLMFPVSGPVVPPVPVVLDRPFVYRIIDDESGATLFIGQVTNPTA